jgi:hypothetical protein
MTWKAAGVVAFGLAAASAACSREAPRPAATAAPAAPGIVATAAAPAAAPVAAPAAAPVGAAAPPPPAGGTPAAGVLAREETKWPGIAAEVTEFRRKGNTLTAKVRFRNQGTAVSEPDIYYSQCYLMDAAAGKKYEVLKDENKTYIAGLRSGYPDRWYDHIQPGGDMLIWMKFPAPPAEVKAITLQLPGVPPFDDLAIQDF